MTVGNDGCSLFLPTSIRTSAPHYVVPEPVPVRFGNLQAIAATTEHPHAALLWLEWLAGGSKTNRRT